MVFNWAPVVVATTMLHKKMAENAKKEKEQKEEQENTSKK
jgi:hypothetical protein